MLRIYTKRRETLLYYCQSKEILINFNEIVDFTFAIIKIGASLNWTNHLVSH
jgi:hypothetical protein